MSAADYIVLCIAMVGLMDCWLDRWTGKGWVERTADWFDRRKHG